MADVQISDEDRRALAALAAQNPLLRIMPQICDWLRANGITPGDVPTSAVPTVTDGQITIEVYLRRDGQRYLDEHRKPAKSRATVPLLVEPSDVLKPWLAGKMPPPPLTWDSESTS